MSSKELRREPSAQSVCHPRYSYTFTPRSIEQEYLRQQSQKWRQHWKWQYSSYTWNHSCWRVPHTRQAQSTSLAAIGMKLPARCTRWGWQQWRVGHSQYHCQSGSHMQRPWMPQRRWWPSAWWSFSPWSRWFSRATGTIGIAWGWSTGTKRGLAPGIGSLHSPAVWCTSWDCRW